MEVVSSHSILCALGNVEKQVEKQGSDVLRAFPRQSIVRLGGMQVDDLSMNHQVNP